MSFKQWSVGIFLFDEVEVLDFAGPFEVFSVTAYPEGDGNPFIVKTISENGKIVNARNGLKIQPDYTLKNAPHFDIIVIPGGPGIREREIHNEEVIKWIADRMGDVQLMTSVCTGAFLLAKAELLDGRRATTHWATYDLLEREFPQVNLQRHVKYVDEGRIITSGGISAGINMTFHIVEILLGSEIAQRTALRMEYDLTQLPLVGSSKGFNF